jgi:lipoprotein-anchoring transpeptidase ErfK/SrfK
VRPAPSAPAPVAPAPVVPGVTPVEPGPRPYTPPAGSQPPPEEAEDGQGGTTPPATTTNPPAGDAATVAPTPGAPQLAPGEERTRESLQAAEVNAATFSEAALAVRGANPLVLKAQILLDRAGASPGVIDAYAGGNLAKAVATVETVLKLSADGELDRQIWEALRGDSTQDVLVQYTITDQDLAYPFAASIPEDYSQQARMPSLAFTSVEEMLGERFHMDTKLLRALNPDADFGRAGTAVWVASVDAEPVNGTVATIVADKGRSQVRGYDAQNRLIVAYPATIGSAENPSPSGQHRVEAVAPNPVYYYDPSVFVQGNNTQKLELPSGPNNPVGSVWIDLSDPGYGIHGTPDPTKIGKTASHGCVRLTNWDAEELASMVEPGVVVSFQE